MRKGLEMERETIKGEVREGRPSIGLFLIAQIVLRILATAFGAASIGTLVTSNQIIYMRDEMTYIPLVNARYTYSSALRYLLVIDIMVCAYSFLSLILVYKTGKISKKDHETSFNFYMLLLDGVMMALVISGCAAATAIGFVALEGLNKPGLSWAPVCSIVGKFCLKITLSVASSYATFACLAVLTFIAACKLKCLAMKVQPLPQVIDILI